MNAEEWNKKGEDYWQNNNIEDALKSFQKATQLEPEFVAALYNEGAALIQLSENSRGKETIQKAIKIREDDAVGHVWLAIAEYRLGSEGLAKTSIKRALEIEPNERFAQMVKRYIENGAEIILN